MEQQTQQTTDEPISLAQAKQNICKKLTTLFSTPAMNERLMKMAGGDVSRIAKNLTSFLSVIMEDKGSGKPKKYYCYCTTASLTMCFLESMNMQLPFDSRKLVAMIIYDGEAELDISYKGFVNALNRHFDNAFVECKLVFEKDIFDVEINDRIATYKYKPADPFAVIDKDFSSIKGGYCFFSYTDKDGAVTSRLVFLSKAQILKNKSRAQSQYVWESDPKAMGEKTCIREGARLPFASIDLEVDIEEVDNRHYRLEDESSSGNRLAQLMEKANGLNEEEKPETKAEEVKQTDDAAKQPEGAAVDETTKPMPQSHPNDPTIIDNNDPHNYAELGEDDFADPNAPIVTTVAPSPSPAPAAPAAVAEPTPAPAAATGTLWDGKTLYMSDGKHQQRDFASPWQAFLYLKKVMESRKHKASRLKMIELNIALVNALIKDGKGSAIAEMHKLAGEGI